MNFYTEYYLKLNKKIDNKYSLKSIVIHKGTKDSGHYYIYIKNINNKWYICNDENVNLVDKSEALKIAYCSKNIGNEDYNQNGYILVYEKDNCDKFEGITYDILNKINFDILSKNNIILIVIIYLV